MELGRQAPAGRRSLGVAVEDLGPDLDQSRLPPAGVVERHALERRGDARRQRVHRGVLVGAGERDLGRRVERLADHHQRAGAEPPALLEHQTDGEDAHPDRPALELRLEGDTRRAGAQRQQVRLVVARAFGENRHHAAPRQLLVTAGEGLAVALARLARSVLPAHDREDPGEIEDLRQHRDLPQRALAEHARRQAQRSEDEHRIDEPVGVVGDHHQRATLRQTIAANDLDSAEEEEQQPAAEPADQRVESSPHDRGRARGRSSRCRGARSTPRRRRDRGPRR